MSPEGARGRGWVRIPASRVEAPPSPGVPAPPPPPDRSTIYLSLVRRWREAGLTLPGHPDEEWERLVSQPCWPRH